MSAMNRTVAGSAVSRALRPFRLAIVPAVLLLAACDSEPGGENPGAGGAPPPPQVGVVTVALAPIDLKAELPGRLEASRVAQVRARVAGILQKRVFREGSDVQAGQPLFEIDPKPYRAALASAQAALAKAEANLNQAAAQAKRYKPLVSANAVSRQDYETAVAAAEQAEAEVEAAKAAVQTAQINLDYASVTAPIGGRIGRALVTEGALVGQGEATPLAVVQQIRPLYVNFTQSATEVLDMRRALDAGKLRRAGNGDAVEVRIVLEDGTEYPHPGKLLFADLSVDPSSGQVMLRAELPNPEGLLLPGMYVRVRLSQAEIPSATLVPQQAVTRTSKGDTVLVVGPENKPEQRAVKVGPARGNEWIIVDGLKDGERVIVDGFQKMQPSAPVTPVPWKGGSAATVAGKDAPSPKPTATNGGPKAGAGEGAESRSPTPSSPADR